LKQSSNNKPENAVNGRVALCRKGSFDGATAGRILPKAPFPENVWGVLKKSIMEIVNFGDQADLVCWRNQQTASQ
jgi:hypothetical protein